MKPCRYCRSAYFTDQNYGEKKAIYVPGGRVHLGCMGRWLVEDAISRNFPGITPDEEKVLRLRLGLDKVGGAVPTHSGVGRQLGRSGMWASSLQRNAFKRLKWKLAADKESVEKGRAEREVLFAVYRAAEQLVEVLKPEMRSQKVLDFGLDFGLVPKSG